MSDIGDPASTFSRISCLRLLLAGIMLRLLLMPFALHFDFFLIEHVTDLLARYGTVAFDQRVMGFYFPSVVYLVKLPFHWLALLFSPEMGSWLESTKDFIYNARPYENWMAVLLDVQDGIPLFRNIFLLKLCQLACDLVIAVILWRMVPAGRPRKLALLLWAINPVALHAVFAHGGIDIIPALWIAAALVSAMAGRPYWTIAFLLLGTFSKLTPIILIPPFILSAERRLAARVRLSVFAGLLGGGIYLLLFGPLGAHLAAVLAGPGEMMADVDFDPVNLARKLGLAGSYLLFLAWLYRRQEPDRSLLFIATVFLVPYFLLFTFNPIGFRYFVWISMPLVAFLAIRPGMLWLVTFNLLALFVLQVLPQQSLQMGIFVPLCPEYLLSFPAVTKVTATLIPQFWLLRLFNLVFIASSFALALYIWGEATGRLTGLRRMIQQDCRAMVFTVALGLAGLFLSAAAISPDAKQSFALWLGGYRGQPDSMLILPAGTALRQDLNWGHYGFDSFELWLDKAGAEGVSAALAGKRFIPSGMASGAGYRRFRPEDGTGAYRGAVTLEMMVGELVVEPVKVGLIPERGINKLKFDQLYGRWLMPNKGIDGQLRLATPLETPLDFRIASQGLPPERQLALNFYRTSPAGLPEALGRIADRLRTDLPFLYCYLGLLGLVLLALLAAPALLRRH